MKRRFVLVSALFVLSTAVMGADTIPANLPRPDGEAPTKGQKVKVYILAGQSNMVGFGRIAGGGPLYSYIYLSADPTVMPRNLGKDKGALLPMRIYPSAAADSWSGAMANVYKGAYDPNINYAKMTPAKVASVKLGTTAETLPTIEGDHTVVVKAFIEVPMTGNHEVHVGMGDSTYAVASVDGKEVYRKDADTDAVITSVELKSGQRYPITITYMKGGSAALWMKLVDLKLAGNLTTLTKAGKYPWFLDDKEEWSVRNDVIYWDVRTSKEEIGDGGPLSVKSNGGTFIGPEIPFGFVMGEFHDEPVLLIESSMGNRAINFDFRPPSSGKTAEDKANKFCGLEYDMMVAGARKALKNIDKIIPGYEGQGYEIVGFVWWQGHKDSGQTKEQYEKHLVNLIQDLRKEFKAPNMRAVVATVGFGGWNLGEGWVGVHAAQMAVADPKQHPEFAGNVATVDTRGYWRSRRESPTGTGYHYNHNAETQVLTGDALGRAMVKMLGGQAEAQPGARPQPEEAGTKPLKDMSLSEMADLVHSDAFASTYSHSDLEPTADDIAAMGAAMTPIVLDDMLPTYIGSVKAKGVRKGRLSAKSILNGADPACNPGDGSLKCELDEIITHYHIAGITDYDWKRFGSITKDSTWNYFSFDPPEKQDLAKSKRNRKVTVPAGMEQWMTTGFNAGKAGWKKGAGPFGQKDGQQKPLTPGCTNPNCGCGAVPTTLWEKEVLLLQQNFEIPELKEGHLYRLVLGGAQHTRKGEGYTVYVNGKPFAEAQGGYFRHMNGARGGYITADFLPEFKSGKVTIAIKAFLRYTHFNNKTMYFGSDPEYHGKPVPPNGNISVWMEQAKLPETVNVLIDNK